MEWSVDSEMLAVVVSQDGVDSISGGGGGGSMTAGGSGGSGSGGSVGGGGGGGMTVGGGTQRQRWVQVWRRSNWHWYLKRETRHDASQVNLLHMI